MSRVGAIDVGTNSVRLLVAEAGEPLLQVERLMEVTRLGKGVDEVGHLDDGALERTVACIGRYADRARELGASALRITATSAIRDAADRDRFLARVRERAGVDVEVLSGFDEAATAFAGATRSLAGDAPYLVLDIGGGSTELILGEREPVASTSRQLGCVRLTERCLPSDPPTRAELEEAAAVVDAELEAAAAEVDVASARTLVGIAGTVTTLAALHLGLEAYEAERIHGTRIPHEAVAELTRTLAGLCAAERAALGPMAPGREDVIAGGALILERVMARFGFDDVLVSEADILDGLALAALQGP